MRSIEYLPRLSWMRGTVEEVEKWLGFGVSLESSLASSSIFLADRDRSRVDQPYADLINLYLLHVTSIEICERGLYRVLNPDCSHWNRSTLLLEPIRVSSRCPRLDGETATRDASPSHGAPKTTAGTLDGCPLQGVEHVQGRTVLRSLPVPHIPLCIRKH